MIHPEQQKRFHEQRDDSTGSALIVVLWVVTILSLFVMSFAFAMHIETRITSTWRKRIKAEYLARSGVALARMALQETGDPDIDLEDTSTYLAKGDDTDLRNSVLALAQGGGATISRTIGSNTVSVQITPENAKMDINGLIFPADRERTFKEWENIFKVVGVPMEERDALVDCLIDWVDDNDFSHLNGAESSYYETLDPPYQAKNAAFDTIDELALVKGFEKTVNDTETTVFEAVKDHLTCYGVGNKININAVDISTLTAFLNIDEEIAEEILAERIGPDGEEGTEDDAPFKDLNDLLSRVPFLDSAVGQYITFSSSGLYKVRCSATVGLVEFIISCVILYEDNDVLILEWTEGDDEEES